MNSVVEMVVIVMLAFLNETPTETFPTLYRTDQTEIIYYLQHPKERNLLVLIQGSDCNNVIDNQFINEAFSPLLPNSATLMVEKYGLDRTLPIDHSGYNTQCPSLYMQHDSPTQRVFDYQLVIDALQAQYHYENIVILGGSEGGLVAIYLAKESDKVSATIMMNSGGPTIKKDIEHNIRMMAEPNNLEQELVQFKRFQQAVLSDRNGMLEASQHGMKWWHDMLTINQETILMTVDTPVLMMQTLDDEWTSSVEAIKMNDRLQKLGKTNITFKTYAGLNHAFKNEQGERKIEPLIKDIDAWINEFLTK